MSLDFNSTPPDPPQRRFGPVTLLALVGGVIFGPVGVLVAHAAGSA